MLAQQQLGWQMETSSVDVSTFFARPDISADARKRVKEAGDTKAANPAEARRAMQVQILIEEALKEPYDDEIGSPSQSENQGVDLEPELSSAILPKTSPVPDIAPRYLPSPVASQL
jgi:hypothetical protein